MRTSLKTFGQKFLRCFTCKTLSYELFEFFKSIIFDYYIFNYHNMEDIEENVEADAIFPLVTLSVDMIGKGTSPRINSTSYRAIVIDEKTKNKVCYVYLITN